MYFYVLTDRVFAWYLRDIYIAISKFKNYTTMLPIGVITRASFRKPDIQSLSRGFHKSSIVLLDDKWREKNRLTRNPNAFGPLTNMPDYSFKDGRPVPFGIKQMIRINRQRDYLLKIKQLSGEMNDAVELHAKMEEEKALERQKIIDSKLKPKGHPL